MPRSSIPEPFTGNILIIGDAAAFIEVENQGALMCGFQGGNAVYAELGGADGFRRYGRWWRDSFEFNHPELLKTLAVTPALKIGRYSDEEIDYLFSLIDGEELEGTCSQYRSGIAIWKAILRHSETLREERPELYAKMEREMNRNVGEVREENKTF